MPPSAAPEWLLTGWIFESSATSAPASNASIAARMPAQPAPTMRTSCLASTAKEAIEAFPCSAGEPWLPRRASASSHLEGLRERLGLTLVGDVHGHDQLLPARLLRQEPRATPDPAPLQRFAGELRRALERVRDDDFVRPKANAERFELKPLAGL